MKPNILIAAVIACAAQCFAHGASETAGAPRADIASRDIGDPEANRWEEGEWPTAAGEISILDERPDAPAAPKDHKALRLTIHYAPRSFGGWSAHPKAQTLPGKVLKINITPGQSVKFGEVVIILEAMKMETEIVAPADGTIGEIKARVGDMVENGTVLATMS